MATLVDIARAMEKEKASQEPKPTTDASAPSTSAGLSLVDIAKQQQQQQTAKPLTLIDVARKADATNDAASTAASLQTLAKEINDEERTRLDRTITQVATEVKQETAQQRASVLKVAATEVRREEVARTPQRSPQAPADEPKTSPPPDPVKVPESDHDGYSSFGDEDEVEIKKKPSKKPPRNAVEDTDDNQSEAGPEKTTPSDHALAKVFLRAIYRGDARRVRDMMRDEQELDARTADQHGWSALHWAASQSHSEILSLLLEGKNAHVNAVEHVNGWSALHIAVLRDAGACAKKLLRAGGSVRIEDRYGDTPQDLLGAVKGKKKERWLQLLRS